METVSEVKPAIGMSVSMGIGSDSYHEIIVKMERNSKTIYTMRESQVLGGVALEDWNALPESIKAKRAADALQQDLDHFTEQYGEEIQVFGADWAMSQATNCYTFRTTGRKAGHYAMKGSKYCWLKLGSQRSYLDPSF
jgi:hypothetical protein